MPDQDLRNIMRVAFLQVPEHPHVSSILQRYVGNLMLAADRALIRPTRYELSELGF
jgi:hypothetical protein